MTQAFKNIGLMGKLKNQEVADTCLAVIAYLKTKPVKIYLDQETSEALNHEQVETVEKEQLGAAVDLIIVIGGDGSLLNAARVAVHHDTPIVGINRGRLGFLTDIKPNELEMRLDAILAGQYNREERFLIEAHLLNKTSICSALNDIVLASSDNAHMIEFEVYINNTFMCSERADGMITATPTGSTAYALSGGGPIVHPTLDALVLVPMFSHTLTSRPIVVPGNSQIRIALGGQTDIPAKLSVDGQVHCQLSSGDSFVINKKPKTLHLLHPVDYDYFANVRSKLHWGKKLDMEPK